MVSDMSEHYQTAERIEGLIDEIGALRDALIAALEYIDALPKDVVAALPAMPGFGRDDVDELLERTK